jgi:hypothetical protein
VINVNHVTYQLSKDALEGVDALMLLLGFVEVEPDDPFEHGYNVRWFKHAGQLHGEPLIHFVAEEPDDDLNRVSLGLGHLCVKVDDVTMLQAAASRFCVRNSGSGRIWLQHESFRVEVRPR